MTLVIGVVACQCSLRDNGTTCSIIRIPAFTAEIQEPGSANFLEIVTDSAAGHAATSEGNNPGYLDHPQTIKGLWQPLAQPNKVAILTRAFSEPAAASAPPSHRALLVGINAYSDPADRLEGCVNDVYLISELLQEIGFKADNIRLLLDERASREAILERLHWLLDDAGDGNQRFTAVFDCCYAGGLVRSLRARARALSIPLDIQHRMERWIPANRTWEPRAFKPINADLSKSPAYSGTNGATYKLGRAIALRRLNNEPFDAACRLRNHRGPYLPLVLEACREDQLSYEYVRGATRNGAFTYALVRTYRASNRRRAPTTFVELARKVRAVVDGPIPRVNPEPRLKTNPAAFQLSIH